MLPRPARLTRSSGFGDAVRRGRRAGTKLLVVHVIEGDQAAEAPTTWGFVVSRAVGPAVVRNRVKRRLRHLVAGSPGVVPPGSTVVVRALPPASDASYAGLGRALDRALGRASHQPSDGVRS